MGKVAKNDLDIERRSGHAMEHYGGYGIDRFITIGNETI